MSKNANSTFRAIVHKDIRNNWSAVFPATPDGYGRAFRRARSAVAKFGGSIAEFETAWPDLGCKAGTAVWLGQGVFASVQWLD